MAAGETLKLFCLKLCLFELGLVLCDPQRQTRVIYGAVKGSVTFPVAAPAFFKEILWKKGQYPVITWAVHSQPEPRTFWPFTGRTSLDTESGDLRIFNLTHSDEGEYELESPDIKGDIKFRLKVIDPALLVDMIVPNTTVPEKAAFQLDCSIVSRSSRDSQFAVAWFSLRTKVGRREGRPGLEKLDPTERTALLRVGHDGVFGQHGCPWEGRVCFQKLSLLLLRLTVLQARPQDTGNYSCHVEEWLPGPQGAWYRLTEQESAPISVHVLDTGSILQSVICSNDALFSVFNIFLNTLILIILVFHILARNFPILNTIRNLLDRHRNQELELRQEEQDAPVMDQRTEIELLPIFPGGPGAQRPNEIRMVMNQFRVALELTNYNFVANEL